MTIKQQGGIFGRNPTFNNVTADGAIECNGLTSNGQSNFVGSLGTIYIDDQGAFINFTRNGSNYIRAIGASSSLFISTALKNRVRFLGTGDILFYKDDGSTVGATWDASAGNLAFEAGNGIDFSATSGTGTSELFDDYEEGTFTPVVADAASGGNEGTASNAYGYYTKIGRQVTLQITFLNIDTTGMTGANDLYITGLPFSAESLTGVNYFTGNMSAALLANTLGIGSPEIQDAGSSIRIREWGNNTGTDWAIVSDLTSGSSDLNITITYFAA